MQRALVAAVALALNAGALAAAVPGPVGSAVAVSADGSTALLLAAYEGDAGRVAALLKQGANPRQGNRYGATPLGEAARRGDADIMRLLLNAGADANEANAEGQTALMEVARTGNLAAAMLLLQHGAKIDAREHWGGQTALIWATAQNQPAMIKLLVAKGADVNARATVRDWQRRVTAEGRPKDMNRGGMTPLLYAARDGHLDCVSVLLRAKAQVDLTDPDGTTPLVLALMNGHWDVGKALIEAGADVNQWDFYGQSPLYMAVDLKTLPAGARVELPATDALSGIDMIKLLLAKGANPNMQLKLRPPYRQAVFDRNADFALIAGSTPLLRAAVAADVETMQLLLAAGAKVDHRAAGRLGQQREPGLNQQFGIGAGHQHVFVDCEVQRPEFTPAKQLGYRPPLAPAGQQRVEASVLRGRYRHGSLADEAGAIECQHLAEQEFQIEPGLGPECRKRGLQQRAERRPALRHRCPRWPSDRPDVRSPAAG